MNNRFSFFAKNLRCLIKTPVLFAKIFIGIFVTMLTFPITGSNSFCEEEVVQNQPEPGIAVLEKKLSIKEAITLALENNLDILVEKFNPKISDENVTIEKARFDPSFYINLATDKSIRPSGTSLAGANVVVNRNNSWDTGLKGRIISGENYSLDFTNKRTRTN